MLPLTFLQMTENWNIQDIVYNHYIAPNMSEYKPTHGISWWEMFNFILSDCRQIWANIVGIFFEIRMIWDGDSGVENKELQLMLHRKWWLFTHFRVFFWWDCISINCDYGFRIVYADEVCSPGWDGLVCWPQGSPGTITKVLCPGYVYDFNHKGTCQQNVVLVSSTRSNNILSNCSVSSFS